MSSATHAAATLDDLRRVEGKAELIAGRIVHLVPTGYKPNRVAARIGDSAEAALAAKRADYFEAGTKVVWDVDPTAKLIRSYRALTPDQPAVFRTGQMADAEPAVAGWRLPVDRVFA
jgi:hypothetical protein